MSRTLTTELTGYSFLECPRWHENRLWCSDFYTHQVISITQGDAAEPQARVPHQPAGLGWLPDGRLLVVSMRDRRILRREHSGELVEHADLSPLTAGWLNDMVVDGQGRAYVGDFGFDVMAGEAMRPGVVVRVDPDGGASVVADGLSFPNGCVILPDNTLVIAETLGNRLTAFTIEADGRLAGRRTWAAFGQPVTGSDLGDVLGQLTLAPDGICADAEGALWVADAVHHRVVRVLEGGRITEEIATGQLAAFACTLGGEDGRTLYVCCAPSFAEYERRATRDAVLLSCRVDVPYADS